MYKRTISFTEIVVGTFFVSYAGWSFLYPLIDPLERLNYGVTVLSGGAGLTLGLIVLGAGVALRKAEFLPWIGQPLVAILTAWISFVYVQGNWYAPWQ